MGADEQKQQESAWLRQLEGISIEAQARFYARYVMKCPLLVVERDQSTGFISPVGYAGVSGA